MKRDFLDYVDDVLTEADKIESFIHNMDPAMFKSDERTAYAVIHALEVLGEAATKIPPSIRRQHPGIPWKEIAGMRNKLIHEYFGVDLRTCPCSGHTFCCSSKASDRSGYFHCHLPFSDWKNHHHCSRPSVNVAQPPPAV